MFVAAALAGGGVLPHAVAQTSPSVALEYNLAPGAERCPDEAAVRADVAARLGRDPFQADAPVRVTVAVVREGAVLVGHVEARAAARLLGERVLTSEGSDCTELAAALALAIAIAIDPLAPVSRSSAEAGAPQPVLPVALEALPAAPEAPLGPISPPRADHGGAPDRAAPPVLVFGSAGVLASLGSAPAATGGATIEVGLARGSVSVALAGRADLSGSLETDGGRISASFQELAVLPCARVSGFAGCGILGLGVLRGAGHDVPDAREETTLFFAAGARGAFRVAVGPYAWLEARADVQAPFTRTTIRLGGRGVWRTPSLSGTLGLAVGLNFR